MDRNKIKWIALSQSPISSGKAFHIYLTVVQLAVCRTCLNPLLVAGKHSINYRLGRRNAAITWSQSPISSGEAFHIGLSLKDNEAYLRYLCLNPLLVAGKHSIVTRVPQ